MTKHIPDGYWEDAQGNLVPETKVKEEHKMEDQLVRELIVKAQYLSAELGEFRLNALQDAAAFRQLVGERYGVTKGGAKGNMTLRTFDGRYKVKVAVSDTLSFGPELQAAKDLIDDCIMRWSDGANENIQALVNDAFNVSKEGRIDTGRVLGLRRLNIEDDEWHRAMDAVSDAVRVTHSKTYLRFYSVDPETGAEDPIPLDLAAV